MTKAPKKWLCPICGMYKMPYGKLTCKGKQECGNPPHLTGAWYGKHASTGGKSIGIASISNEDSKHD